MRAIAGRRHEEVLYRYYADYVVLAAPSIADRSLPAPDASGENGQPG